MTRSLAFFLFQRSRGASAVTACLGGGGGGGGGGRFNAREEEK